MGGDIDTDLLFATALIEGTDEALAAWVTVGPEAVDQLGRYLSRELQLPIPNGTSDRVVLDNLSSASFAVARAYPDDYWAAFESGRWDENPFVCIGLGAIRRPEVTERLMRILRNGNQWLRIDAAVALRGHRHPMLEAALFAALEDPDSIVRYHVEERLAEMEDRRRPESEG